MPKVETNARRILDRLAAEGWVTDGGSKHAKLFHPNGPGIVIMVPRHREIAPARRARSLAQQVGFDRATFSATSSAAAAVHRIERHG